MLVHSLIPWPKLTRNGIPDFIVSRRPLLVHGVEVQVGQPVPGEISANRVRLRQLYEQRLAVPAIAPKGSRQEARQNAHVHSAAQTARHTPVSVPTVAGVPFDAPAVPVEEEKSVSAGGYSPARGQGNRNRR